MGMWENAQAAGTPTGAQQVDTSVATLAPMATTYTTQNNLGTTAAQKLPAAPAGGGSILDKLGSFVGTVATQTGGMIGDFAKSLLDTAVSSVTDVGKFGASIANMGLLNADNNTNQKMVDSLSQQISSLSADYRAGRISLADYKLGLKQTDGQMQILQGSTSETQTALAQNATDMTSSASTVAQDLIAIVTAGTSKGITSLAVDGVKTLGDGSAAKVINFFGQKAVSDTLYSNAVKIDNIVQKVITETNVVATRGDKFPSAAIANITHDTITGMAAAGSTLTARQIATNVAMNIIIKKPLIYQTNIGLASTIYTDMQKGDVSGAALTTVITASMALSGGPLGFAFEALGKGGNLLRDAMFSGGNVGKLMEAENATNIRNGLGAQITQEIIDSNAKTSVSKQSFIDALSTKIGSGKANQMYQELVARATAGDVNSYKAIKVMEEVNMKMTGGNSVKAAQLIADHYNGLDGGKWLRSANAGQVIDDMMKWSSARDLVVQDAVKNGLSHAEASRIVIGRANQSDLGLIADVVSAADKSMNWTGEVAAGARLDGEMAQKVIDLRMQMLQQAVDKYGRTAAWANSDTFIRQLNEIIHNNVSSADMVSAITKLRNQTGKLYEGNLSKEVVDSLKKDGYFPIMPKETHTPYVSFEQTTGGLKSAFAPKTGDEFNNKALGLPVRSSDITASDMTGTKANLFEHAVTPVPVLSSVGNFLTKLGLSPEAANDQVQTYFQANFSDIVKRDLAVSSDLHSLSGQDILSKLYTHVRDMNATQRIHAPVMDLRQLTVKEVMAAVGATEGEAKVLMSSLNSAMLKVPVAIRGLGDKVQDINMTFNPTQRYLKYSRIQGAARFTYNPFFRWQQSYQTEGLAQLEAGGKLVQLPFLNGVNRVLFPSASRESDATIKYLQDRNIFGQDFSGVGSTGDVQGLIGTSIIKSEKVSLAGLVSMQAKKMGMSTTDYIDNNQSAVVDTLRMITTNNHTQGFLDSPLSRTINTAFFPFRYNMKVANLMAGYIGKLSAPTQVALIGGMMNASDWLQSDQGVAWQSTHSEAIGLFNWLSPTYPLAYVMKLGQDALGQSSDPSVGDLGLLGGLPFGMITQFMQSAGIIDTQAPYIMPKTGEVYPKYVPNSAIAGVNLAIQDFIGSVFSYPGAIVGLPGKTKLVKNLTSGLIGGNDFTPVDQSGKLSPDQIHQQQVIKAQVAARGGVSTAPATPVTDIAPTPAVTTLPTPTVSAPPRASTASAKRPKKSSYIPTKL